MRIEITIADWKMLLALAADSVEEVCGLLLGQGGRIARIVPCCNVAAEPAIRFEIDPVTLIAAHRAARAGGAAVIGHYHSHPSGDARPSPRDAADAAPDGSIWLIVAGEMVTAWRAMSSGALHGRFDPLAISVVNGCVDPGDSAQGDDASTAR